jgi:hypothetical protein
MQKLDVWPCHALIVPIKDPFSNIVSDSSMKSLKAPEASMDMDLGHMKDDEGCHDY